MAMKANSLSRRDHLPVLAEEIGPALVHEM